MILILFSNIYVNCFARQQQKKVIIHIYTKL